MASLGKPLFGLVKDSTGTSGRESGGTGDKRKDKRGDKRGDKREDHEARTINSIVNPFGVSD